MDDMTVTIDKGELTLKAPLVVGRKSSTGKSNLLLTTSGNQDIAELNGQPVTVSVNIYQSIKKGGK